MPFHMYNSMIFSPRHPLENIWGLPGATTEGKSLWEAVCPTGDFIWKDPGNRRKQWLRAALGSLLSFPYRKTQKCLRKKITYFSFENTQPFNAPVHQWCIALMVHFKCTNEANSQVTFLSDSSTFVSALKLYLAIASPISPGWAGGGGLAGCDFSGGVSF